MGCHKKSCGNLLVNNGLLLVNKKSTSTKTSMVNTSSNQTHRSLEHAPFQILFAIQILQSLHAEWISHDFPMFFFIAMPHGWGFPGHGAAPLRRGRELSWALPGGSSEYWRYYWTKWGFNRDLMGVIYTYMDYMDYIHIQWGLYTLI